MMRVDRSQNDLPNPSVVVPPVDSKCDEWNSCSVECIGHKCVTLLAMIDAMRGIVEFNGGHDPRRLRCGQHEIKMLLRDAATVPAFPFLHRDYIGESHFERYQVAILDGWLQTLVIETTFARAQEVSPRFVGESCRG